MVTQDELPMRHLGARSAGGRAMLAESKSWLFPNQLGDLGLSRVGWRRQVVLGIDTT